MYFAIVFISWYFGFQSVSDNIFELSAITQAQSPDRRGNTVILAFFADTISAALIASNKFTDDRIASVLPVDKSFIANKLYLFIFTYTSNEMATDVSAYSCYKNVHYNDLRQM